MTAQVASPSVSKRFRVPLATQVLLALVLGAMTGLFFGEIVAPLELLGRIFILLLQIAVIPYIVVSLITGLGRLSYDDVKSLAVKGGGVLVVLWGIGIVLVVLLPLSYPDWPTQSFFRKSEIEPGVAPDFLRLYIPSNPFFSLANAMVPAIVLFSILFGLAVIGVKHKELIIEPLSALGETLARISGFVAKLAPIGVFALIASMTGSMSFEELARLQVYVVVHVLMALVLALWLLPALASSVTPLRHGDILRLLRTPLVTAFATGSTLVVLPLLAENCKSLVAEARIRRGMDEEEAESSVDVLIPTFFSFPTVGNVVALGFVLFAGWYIGSPVSPADYPAVVLGGIASLFAGVVLAIPFVLELAELPRSLLQVFLSLDVIGGRFTTLVSAMHYTTIALIGTFGLQGMARLRVVPLVRTIAIAIALVFAVLVGVRAFYTYVVVVPYTKAEALKGLSLLRQPQPAVIHKTMAAPTKQRQQSRSYSQILESKVLRACYLDGNFPLSYFNSQGDLVGFDIEMAHRLAMRMQVTLEFWPVTHLGDVPALLEAGYCDVLFNSVAMTMRRVKHAAQTDPFNTVTMALLVPDHRRDDFRTWAGIRQQGEISIVTSAFQSLPQAIWARMPDATIELLTSMEEQQAYFESKGERADAFLDAAEEGAAWTILYPRFTVVVPRPVVQVPIVYLVARNNPSLLRVMNAWLRIETHTGGIEELYDYWIQGEIGSAKPPRWSIVRDVLHWVD